jgi:L-ascorbate metabolism protein UlaG (beta-lactamase superfamily)
LPLHLGEPVGFIITLPGGPRIYFAGDTALFGDMRLIGELYRPDVAFLPIGGHFTMDPTAAAKATELIAPRIVVPLHYGTFPALAGTPDELRAELARLGLRSVVVMSPEPGERVS